MEKRGEFPQRVTLGENRVAWWEDEVDAWIESRIRAGRKIAGPRRVRETSEKEAE
jgi:predicted DNA-binding transcriptional regulator AlpA